METTLVEEADISPSLQEHLKQFSHHESLNVSFGFTRSFSNPLLLLSLLLAFSVGISLFPSLSSSLLVFIASRLLMAERSSSISNNSFITCVEQRDLTFYIWKSDRITYFNDSRNGITSAQTMYGNIVFLPLTNLICISFSLNKLLRVTVHLKPRSTL